MKSAVKKSAAKIADALTDSALAPLEKLHSNNLKSVEAIKRALIALQAGIDDMAGAMTGAPLIRVFHNSPTTHHNPPQLTITRHNSPQVPEVQVVAPQLTTTYLASFHLYMPLPQPATTCYNPLS